MADRDDLLELASADSVGAERIATGLTNPLFVVAPPEDFDRLFILEKNTGEIKILDLLTGTINAKPFLDLEVSTVQEQGLLGLAFDPDYRENGLFYVNYTDTDGVSIIERYQVSGDADVADASSGEIISKIAQPDKNNNGGWIGFGPDGYLYYGTGDGGGSHDPDNNSQDLTVPLGKMLRIDVRSGTDGFPADPSRNYAIPEDNPFIGVTVDGKPVREDIWAYGLRNPWRPSFDRETGDLYIGDVGQMTREEINFQPADSTGGENYGWRVREGGIANPTEVGGPRPEGNVDPVYDYPHGEQGFLGRSVTGGYVYRGPVTELQGKYIFSDFVSSQIWSFEMKGGGITGLTNWTTELQADQGDIRGIASFGEDAAGNLYIVDFFDGEVFRFVGKIPTPGDDLLVGTPVANTIDGLAGDDNIDGLGGNDLLLGSAGNVTPRGGFGFDTLDGGEGTDTADLSHTSAGADIDLATGNVAIDGGVEMLISIENAIGTNGDNVMTGTDGANRLEGGGGNDTLKGGFGFDTLDGGDGTDTADLSHSDAAPEIDLAAGQVVFGSGVETLISIENAIGSNGDNVMTGTGGANTLAGGGGNDSLEGNGGADRFWFQGTAFDQDTIIDFALGTDKIAFDGVGGADDPDDLTYEARDFDDDGTDDGIRITFVDLGEELADEQIDVLNVSDIEALKADILFG